MFKQRNDGARVNTDTSVNFDSSGLSIDESMLSSRLPFYWGSFYGYDI
jgi:hypothetical protein